MKKLNLIIVDDHSLFRSGMSLLLSDFKNLNTIFEASNGREFLNILKTNTIDIALMDISMPEMDGIEATRLASQLYPDTKIIALSMYGDEAYYFKMIDAGAKGFILKNSDINEVRRAIENVSDGNSYFSSEILYNVLKNIKSSDFQAIKNSQLTERENEVLFHICKGLSNQEIADLLHVSKRTIDKHRENLLLKTYSKNTASLVIYAIKNKLVEI